MQAMCMRTTGLVEVVNIIGSSKARAGYVLCIWRALVTPHACARGKANSVEAEKCTFFNAVRTQFLPLSSCLSVAIATISLCIMYKSVCGLEFSLCQLNNNYHAQPKNVPTVDQNHSLIGSHTLLPDRLVYHTPSGPSYVGVASYLHAASGFVAT